MDKNIAIPAEMRRTALAECAKFVDYWDDLCGGGTGEIRPTAHQARRVYEAMSNGNRRILCADATSSGKTLVTTLMHSKLSGKMGRPARTLVWAPDQAIRTAWSSEEQNAYCRDLGMDPMRVVSIMDRGDLPLLDTDFDIAAVNYHKFGYMRPDSKDGNPYYARIREWCESRSGPDMLVFDECHWMKNPDSNKTRVIDDIVNLTKDRYLVLLSAYPVPNRLRDAGVALHLLEPDKYPLAPFHYNSNPQIIRDLKMQGKLFTFTRGDLKELFGLPDLHEDTIQVDLMGDQVERYMKYWKDGYMLPGEKIPRLRKVLLEPKYDALERVVDDITGREKDAQVLVFTYLRDGVTDEVARRLERVFPGRVGRIDGTVNRIEDRVELARQYREGEIRALANTIQTMGEGIPLTTKDRPSHIIVLEPAMTPCDHGEMIGRGYRKGQEAPVYCHTMLSVSQALSDSMERAKGPLEEDFGVEFRSTWEPRTLDEDAIRMRVSKERILQDKIYEGLSLSEVEERIMNADTPNEAARLGLASLPRKSTDKKLKLFMGGMIRGAGLYGLGSEEIGRASRGEGPNADRFAGMRRSYSVEDDKHLPPGKTAGLVTRVIAGLEEFRGRKFGRILDLGCGSANLARALGRPVVNFDIDEGMLEEAKKRCEGLQLEYVEGGLREMRYVQGNMADMLRLFQGEQFDLLTASYSMMYLAQGQNGKPGEFQREVEDALISSNALLLPNGYLIVTLPRYRTNDKMFEAFNDAVASYGFRPVVSDLFTGRATVDGRSRRVQQAYLVAAEKVSDCEGGYSIPLGGFLMYRHTPSMHAASGGLSKIYLGIKFSAPSYGDDVRYSGKGSGNLDDIFSHLRLDNR